MSKEKLKDRLAMLIVIIGLVAVIIVMGFSEKITTWLGGSGHSMEYEEKLFDTDEIISINIKMNEEEWQELIDNAINEEYYRCDVEVNGVLYQDVAIRAKGNTSLSQIYSNDTTDRYSFKIEFDYYIKGQTCMGLDKLVLNNNYADATNMKEYIVYDMFSYLGADASLYNYANISVNGETWGVYLALEAVEESFALRNYGINYGELYKPETTGGGGQDIQDIKDMVNATEGEERQNMPGELGQERLEGFGGGMFSSGGSDLNYIDDDVDSYSTIWDGSIFDTGESDHKRVVKALKNISEGNNLETYMDVDNVLKYLAVHSFVVNLDSLSGNMTHNYYLYEDDGQLSIIPWDYNLAFGGFTSSNASDMVNFPIDTPFSSGISLEDREFFAALLENDEYLEKYHSYLNQLVEEYVYGGRFEEVYNHVRSTIDGLVAEDPTALYSYEEYEAASEMLYDTINLRAKSIEGQLNGSIPSTTEGQSADSSQLVEASSIDLQIMGTMNMGNGGGMNNIGNFPNFNNDQEEDSSNGEVSDSGRIPEASSSEIPNMGNGQSPDTSSSQGPGGNPGQMPGTKGEQSSDENSGFPGAGGAAEGMPSNSQGGQQQVMPGMGDEGVSPNSNIPSSTNSYEGIIIILICLGTLLLAMVFVKKYKKRTV